MRLLCVCLGNICRSPLAEGLLAAQLHAEPAAPRHQLDSAGTGAWHVGQPPDPRAIQAARSRGVDIAAQRARQVRPADFSDFDLILCADRSNLAALAAMAPAAAPARIALLLDWCGVGEGRELPDPYLGGPADFEHVCDLLLQAAVGLRSRLNAAAVQSASATNRVL